MDSTALGSSVGRSGRRRSSTSSALGTINEGMLGTGLTISIPSQGAQPNPSSNAQGSAVNSTASALHPGQTGQSASYIAPISAILHDDPKKKAKNAKATPVVRTEAQKQVSLFSHLPQYDRQSSLSSGIVSSHKTFVHPSIIRLGLQYANYNIVGANARCVKMLTAFKDVPLVISDYQLPSEQVLSRHLEGYLRPLIAFLVQARPLAVSMGHAIRYLKLKISTISPDVSEGEAKQMLYDAIDSFTQNRIELADQLIVQHALTKIADGDVICTYGRSQVVRDLLIAAFKAGSQFRVIVVDSRPFLEGRRMLSELVEAGLKGRCTYVYLNALGFTIKEVSKTIIGAHCIYSNGALMSRVGTAMVAMMSQRANAPVIACVETCKFSERVQVDSFVFNEIGDPDVLVGQHLRPGFPEPLAGWRSLENLKLLNILYDVTAPEHISMVISEVGMIPVTSIPVVLREYSVM